MTIGVTIGVLTLELTLGPVFILTVLTLGSVTTDAGKSDSGVTRTAFIITVVSRGALASVISPALFTYSTVGTPDTAFFSAYGVF